MKTIVLTGGGTAGHVMPNIALLPELRKHFERIIYIGSVDGIERKLLTEHKDIEFYAVETVKLVRKLTITNLAIPYKLLKGRAQARQLIKNFVPSVVFSKGGFVALPVVLAAASLGVPIVSHESDLSLGLANRLSKNKVKVICTSFKQTAKSLNNGVYVGTPIRNEILKASHARAKGCFNLSSNKPVVLVVGGSSGAISINKALRNALPTLTKKYQIIHSCGKGGTDRTITNPDYKQFEYISDMGGALAASDIVVSRGGSNAIFEILALQKPMLIIPLPKGVSRGDQEENAKIFKQNGWARVLYQDELGMSVKQPLTSPCRLTQEIDELFNSKDKIKKELAKVSLPNAVDNIIKILLQYSG